MKKVYLAGQPNKYDPWRSAFADLNGFVFYDPDIDSDQSSPDTYFPQDLEAVSSADFLVANVGTKPSEGTWIEIGYFLRLSTKTPGEQSKRMVIIYPDDREPRWSIDFVKKSGLVVPTVEEAVHKLQELYKDSA